MGHLRHSIHSKVLEVPEALVEYHKMGLRFLDLLVLVVLVLTRPIEAEEVEVEGAGGGEVDQKDLEAAMMEALEAGEGLVGDEVDLVAPV